MKPDIHRYNAFPKTIDGGNPAGVVFQADNLSEDEMQKIAADIGFSETAFVLKSALASYKVRFFTPISEVNLCGHATIATFNALRDHGHITLGSYTQETKAGILSLDVKKNRVFMEQNAPKFYNYIQKQDIEVCFEENNFVHEHYPIRVISTGIKEIFVPIKRVDIMNNLTPIYKNIEALSKMYNTIGIHVFALANDEADIYGRNFAPVVGINEESATGTSNGALACYLHNIVLKGQTRFIMRQGYSMNKPSEIIVKLDTRNNQISRVSVGGTATVMNVEQI